MLFDLYTYIFYLEFIFSSLYSFQAPMKTYQTNISHLFSIDLIEIMSITGQTSNGHRAPISY